MMQTGESKKNHETVHFARDSGSFVYQCELSGINDQTPHDIVWYKSDFLWKSQKKERSFSFILRQLTTRSGWVTRQGDIQEAIHLLLNMTPYLVEGEKDKNHSSGI